MAREKNPESSANRKRAPRKTSAVPEPAPQRELTQPPFVDPQQRAALIARAAYFRAMNRGFAPGDDVADWLAAEAEVDAELLRGASAGAADG
jgi:Protein of unknown function (DUF2934)